jgi:hypothetical protein
VPKRDRVGVKKAAPTWRRTLASPLGGFGSARTSAGLRTYGRTARSREPTSVASQLANEPVLFDAFVPDYRCGAVPDLAPGSLLRRLRVQANRRSTRHSTSAQSLLSSEGARFVKTR